MCQPAARTRVLLPTTWTASCAGCTVPQLALSSPTPPPRSRTSRRASARLAGATPGCVAVAGALDRGGRCSRACSSRVWLCQLSNFFDPDSYLSITAMSYAFDDYLFEQSRGLLETNEQFMCTEDISVRVSRAVVAWRVAHAMWASRNHVCDMSRACVARASCPTTLSTGARTTPRVAAAKTWYVRMWYGHVCVMWLFMQCVLACVFVCAHTGRSIPLCHLLRHLRGNPVGAQRFLDARRVEIRGSQWQLHVAARAHAQPPIGSRVPHQPSILRISQFAHTSRDMYTICWFLTLPTME